MNLPMGINGVVDHHWIGPKTITIYNYTKHHIRLFYKPYQLPTHPIHHRRIQSQQLHSIVPIHNIINKERPIKLPSLQSHYISFSKPASNAHLQINHSSYTPAHEYHLPDRSSVHHHHRRLRDPKIRLHLQLHYPSEHEYWEFFLTE